MLLVWKEQFAIDHGPIDHDHKILVNRINDVLRCLTKEGQAKGAVNEIRNLRMHAEFHFRREEHFQAQVRYPWLDAHVAEHRQLLAQIDGVLNEIECLAPDAQIPDYKKKKALMYRWIIHHLIETDMKMRPFLHNRSEPDQLAQVG
jgi:hemerythrin